MENLNMSSASNIDSNNDELQKSHYDEIAFQYQKHYDCPLSRKYRNRFIYEPMFNGSDLSGKYVLEAMCGSGQATDYLLSKGCHVTGLDISSSMIKLFKKRWLNCEAICRSFFDNGIKDESFDCVVIIGGLHHLQPRVNEAINEVYRILKPGGHLYFIEPNSGSIPNVIRTFWMKVDPFFEKNEKAIDLKYLQRKHSSQFEFAKTIYGGGIAYLLILNSMVLRIPLFIKPLMVSMAMFIESTFKLLQGKRTSCFVICQWQKKCSGV